MSNSRFKEYDPLSCLNCGTDYPVDTKFCPNCGQKNRKLELTIKEWVAEGLSTFFHLEGKSWNTVRDLFVPGRLISNYLNGQRQRYLHPFRLLIFSSLVFFAAFSFSESLEGEDQGIIKHSYESAPPSEGDTSTTDEPHKAYEYEEEDEIPNLLSSFSAHELTRKLKDIDILRAEIINYDRFSLLSDSLKTSGYATDSSQLVLLDSLSSFYAMPEGWKSGSFLRINNQKSDIDFDARLLASGTPEEVIASKAYDRWLERLVTKRAVALFQEGSESIGNYLESNLSWAVLIYVPLLAFGYKLFYRRKLPFYTQHLTYASILMSVAMLLGAVALLLSALLNGNVAPKLLALVTFLGYNIVSDKTTFKVSYIHAILKFNPIGLYGILAFSLASTIWLIAAVLLA